MKSLRQILTLVVGMVLSQFAMAEYDWKVASSKFIDETVVPAYGRFIEASQDLIDASEAYCQSDMGVSSDALINAYHQAADAWQGIQIYRSGPAQVFNRHSRIETWPGVSKIANKQMRQLIAAEDKAALEDSYFRKSSTTLQGFPALERLLFAEQPLQPQSYACLVTQTIARNLRSMGEHMLEDWRGTHKQQINRAGETDSYLSSAEDAAAELLTDFYTQIYAISDQKLGRPYAKTKFRYKRAESWRSRRSLRNVRINIESAEAYYKSLFMPAMQSGKSNQKILDLFSDAKAFGALLGDDIAVVHEQSATKIGEWREILERLRKLVQMEMPKALGITIGFNALDGDG